MPAHWEPWPGNTKTTPVPAAADPVTTFAAGSPAASACRPPRSSARSSPRTTPRLPNLVRVVASDAATSRIPTSGFSSTKDARRAACARSAAPVRPDSSHATGPPASSAGPPSAAGTPDSTTWQLVPPTPNEDTPACPPGHSSISRTTSRPSSASGMSGWGRVKFRLGGSIPWCAANATLTRPATPAAASRWPMFVFTDPVRRGASRPTPYAPASAAASTGSPARVPVPCSSTYRTASGSTPPRRQAASITARCASGFGTVRPSVAPSLPTAVPSITQ